MHTTYQLGLSQNTVVVFLFNEAYTFTLAQVKFWDAECKMSVDTQSISLQGLGHQAEWLKQCEAGSTFNRAVVAGRACGWLAAYLLALFALQGFAVMQHL